MLAEGVLDLEVGLVGDTWLERGSKRTPDGSAHPDMQLNVMNARAAALVADGPERMALAGDQLYVDLDLSPTNLPAGTRLTIGSAVIEVTAAAAHRVRRSSSTASARRPCASSTAGPGAPCGCAASTPASWGGSVRPGDAVLVTRPRTAG